MIKTRSNFKRLVLRLKRIFIDMDINYVGSASIFDIIIMDIFDITILRFSKKVFNGYLFGHEEKLPVKKRVFL